MSVTNLDERHQVAAVCMSLRGSAQEVINQMDPTEILSNDNVIKIQVLQRMFTLQRLNPVSYILATLAAKFAAPEQQSSKSKSREYESLLFGECALPAFDIRRSHTG